MLYLNWKCGGPSLFQSPFQHPLSVSTSPRASLGIFKQISEWRL
jgi:hypothetical protein